MRRTIEKVDDRIRAKLTVGAEVRVDFADAKLEVQESGAMAGSKLRQRSSGRARERGLRGIDARSRGAEDPVDGGIGDGFLDDAHVD